MRKDQKHRRLIEIHTDRHTELYAQTPRCMDTQIHIEIHTDRHTEIYAQTPRCTDIQTDTQRHR